MVNHPALLATAFPLPLARPGQRVRVVTLIGSHRMKHRLAELGLTPGVEVTLIQNSGGPLLLRVRDSRLAIGRNVAHNLSVIPIKENQDVQ